MAPAIPFIALALTAGATAYQVHQAGEARSDAKKAQDEQAAQQRKLQSDLASQQAGRESKEAALRARDDARRRQAALSAGGGRQGTILTQGLGQLGGGAQGAQKTLLGA